MDQPPPEGRGLAWVNAAKSLTFGNVLTLAALMAIAVPVYVIYRALGDDALLDRLMSKYEVVETKDGCTLRHVQERGGPEQWGISSGFAFQGADKWHVNVVLDTKPTADQVAAFCQSLQLIADRMLERGSEVHQGPMPGFATDGSGHAGDLPPAAEKTE